MLNITGFTLKEKQESFAYVVAIAILHSDELLAHQLIGSFRYCHRILINLSHGF